MLKLYNTLSKKIEIFRPIKKGEVKMYSCGPTVYDFAHIGNLRAYVFVDLLKRYLKYRGYKVKHISNITDVDDKTIRQSQTAKQSLRKFTNTFLKAYLEDLDLLNIELPNKTPRATEYIAEMIKMIKKLMKKGYAYRGRDGSIYFKIASFPNYGQLADLKKQNLKPNAAGRLEDKYEKNEAGDFVLWKAWQEKDGRAFWGTELGRGRPGWHIECSAMAMKYLGRSFDIHCGGTDLIFPHHTNEIAQSEAATGQQFVRFWLHNAHLLVNDQKMSKSLGNFYTLKDLLSKGYHPLLARLIFLKTHYRQPLNFTLTDFKEAKSVTQKLLDFLLDLDEVQKSKPNTLDIEGHIDGCRQEFKKAMDEDLNVSLALAAVFSFMNEINRDFPELNQKQTEKIKKFIFELDQVFGLIEPLYQEYQAALAKISKNRSIRALLKKRTEARKNGDYKKADKIRKELTEKRVLVNDVKDGYELRLVEFLS